MIKADSVKKSRFIIGVSLILIIVTVTFLPCLKNSFVNWDDDTYVTNNTSIQDLTSGKLKKIFSSFVYGNYHPVTILSYSLEYYFFKLDPFFYHLTNVILHLVNCLLVFWLMYMLTRNFFVSFLTAILFGVHPLHVESVAWVSERKDVLYALFFLGAIISYYYYLQKCQSGRKGAPYYCFSLILFIFSLLSKAMAVTLPLILLLIDYLVYGNESKSLFDKLKEKTPFFILSFIFGIIAILGQYSIGAVRKEEAFNLFHALMIASSAITFYLFKIILPLKLSCQYPYLGIDSNNYAFYVWSFFAVLIVCIAIAILSKSKKNIIFGGLFFLITILPVLQFIPITSAIVADRYTYVPSLGLFYIFATTAHWIYSKKLSQSVAKICFIIFVIISLGAVSFLTWQRCHKWANSVILWEDAIKNTSHNALAYCQLGNAYDLINKKDEAVEAYKKSLEINPNDSEVCNNLAAVYIDKGEVEKAVELWNKIIQRDPMFATAHFNLAVFYFARGEYGLAVKHCDEVIALGNEVDPQFLERLAPYRK